MVVENGRVSAIIDFGGLAIGDPACDLMVAWNTLDAETRKVFCEQLNVDYATWSRGIGWVVSQAVIYIAYYKDAKPEGCRMFRHALDQALTDYERNR